MASVRSPLRKSSWATSLGVTQFSLYDAHYGILNNLLEYVGEFYHNYEHTSRPYAHNLLVKPTSTIELARQVHKPLQWT